jgi:flagellar hook-associated protein 2
MAGMAVDGLVSGLGTSDLIAKLVQAEGASQRALKTRLAATNSAASAYRTVNTTFLAISAAAEKLTAGSLATARTATSSSTAVTATAGSSAVEGSSVTFAVTSLASTQVSVSNATWTSPTADARTGGPAWPIEFRSADNTTSIGFVDIPAGATLADAAKAINDAGHGIKAAVINLGENKYSLQLTSAKSGEAGGFLVKTATEDATTAGSSFVTTAPAQNATIDLGGGIVAQSATNTFGDLLAGVSVTVTKADPTASVTVGVGRDDSSVADKVQKLVDAVNSAIDTVKTYAGNGKDSKAALRGDYSVTSLAGSLLDAVSGAVGSSGSAAQVGLQLTKDGKVSFDKSKFLTALKDTPELAEKLVLGTVASTGADGVTGGGDDVAAVAGIAGRLLQVAKSASDSTTGTLESMAKGRDTQAKDIQARIEAWDLRLEKRREMLTRQFSAMETALNSLKNQSTWLGGQLSAMK